jgi:hypothetical protein
METRTGCGIGRAGSWVLPYDVDDVELGKQVDRMLSRDDGGRGIQLGGKEEWSLFL